MVEPKMALYPPPPHPPQKKAPQFTGAGACGRCVGDIALLEIFEDVGE